MQIENQFFSAIEQISVAIAIGGIVYGIQWLLFRKSLREQSFFKYLGLKSPAPNQFDRNFILIFLGLALFGILSTFLEFRFSDEFQQLLKSKSSPYGAILQNGWGPLAVVQGLIYCFIQAGGSEEILFRGLIARRLVAALGPVTGNFAQALIFWLMHLAIFHMITGEWISVLQATAFVTSFGMGLILGWANIRRSGQSIGPSWILHGTANFSAFLTLAALWK
jgi:uncharacterized protein